MMSLANMLNIPQTEEQFAIFSFSNQDQHRLITERLAERGIQLPLYSLDPIPLGDLAGWAEQHQQAHVAFTQALGIAGVDLTDVDFRQPGQLAAFIRLHFDEHRQAAEILGIIK